jgi:hypothetical protein
MGPLLTEVRIEQRARHLQVTPNEWAQSITDEVLEVFESGESDKARSMLVKALEAHDAAGKI